MLHRNVAALRALAMAWLPTLLSAYVAGDAEDRGPIGAAISAYATICAADVIAGFFRTAMQKLIKVRPRCMQSFWHWCLLGGHLEAPVEGRLWSLSRGYWCWTELAAIGLLLYRLIVSSSMENPNTRSNSMPQQVVVQNVRLLSRDSTSAQLLKGTELQPLTVTTLHAFATKAGPLQPSQNSFQLQVVHDAAQPEAPADAITEGGDTPSARRATFLDLSLCLAGGLGNAGLTTLFKTASLGLMVRLFVACPLRLHGLGVGRTAVLLPLFLVWLQQWHCTKLHLRKD